MPGCFSPTEILAAHEGGADVVKVFPATSLGPQFIKDVRAPLPQVKLMPTGGVSLDNAHDWIRAGAVAVGLGSALLDAKAIEDGRFDVITANARRVVANVQRAARRREETLTHRRDKTSMTQTKKKNVVTFGEIMLRLSPPGFERFFQSPVLSAIFGGGEANVAASLSHFGLASRYVTRLPKHAIGEAALRALRAEGIDTTHVLRGGDRVGIYFAETGASQRASTVVYDRAHSSISELDPSSVPWDSVMQGAAWFHVTGITPALGSNCAEATRLAIAAAKRAGARVSVDLNYRKKLWTEAQAQSTMRPLMRDVDVVVANEEDLQAVLGVPVAGADVTGGSFDVAGYRAAAERVTREFGPAMVAITLRESLSASDNGWSAVLWDAKTGVMHQSQRYVVRLVDRIGGGDSFAAGLVYSLLTGRALDAALKFAVAASALKQTIPAISTASPSPRSTRWPAATRLAACSARRRFMHMKGSF